MNTAKSTPYDEEVVDELLSVICDMNTEIRARVIFLQYVRELHCLYVDDGIMGANSSDVCNESFLTGRLNNLVNKGLVNKEYAEGLQKEYLDQDIINSVVNDFWSQMNEMDSPPRFDERLS